MFCEKCGVQLGEDAKFCAQCGTQKCSTTTECESTNASTDQQNPEPGCVTAQTPDQPEENGKTVVGFFKRRWKVAMPAAILIVALAIGSAVFFSAQAPLISVSRAFENLGEEMTQRVEGSPFIAFGMLADSFRDGTITVDFDYRFNLWGSTLNDVDGSVTIRSDMENQEIALEADLNMQGLDIDFELYVNNERAAVRSNMLDDNFYGITYSTFRSDIRGFGGLIGLDRATMDMMSDWVEAFYDAMNADHDFMDGLDIGDFEQYKDLFSDFIRNLNRTSERVNIESGGETVSATRVEFTVTADDIIELLNDLYDMLENDDTLRAYFNDMAGDMFGFGGASVYDDEFLDEFRYILDEIERGLDGDITLAFYIGRGDRLLRMELYAYMGFDSEWVEIAVTLDLGASVYDLWILEITVTDDFGTESVSIVWEFSENPRGFIVNTMTATSYHPRGDDTVVFVSAWSPGSGDFTLSYEDDWGLESISGVFLLDGDGGFSLVFDDFDMGFGATLSIGITTTIGAEIEEIEFINLDRWNEALFSLMIGQMLF